jgi:hypothetical protein
MTNEFRSLEVTAFWVASSALLKAIREGGSNIEELALKVENHARYGVQPEIRRRARALVDGLRPATRVG